MPTTEPTEPVRATGVIARSPQGRVLMVRRGQKWWWPSLDECGPWVGGLMKGGDGDVFTVDLATEFAPRLTSDHSGWGWFCPEAALEEARAEEAQAEKPEPGRSPTDQGHRRQWRGAGSAARAVRSVRTPRRLIVIKLWSTFPRSRRRPAGQGRLGEEDRRQARSAGEKARMTDGDFGRELG